MTMMGFPYASTVRLFAATSSSVAASNRHFVMCCVHFEADAALYWRQRELFTFQPQTPAISAIRSDEEHLIANYRM